MSLVKQVHTARFRLSNFQCHVSQPALCEHFDGMSLKCSFALCYCFFKAAHLYLFVILSFHSIPEAVLLIIDPGKPQRGQRQLKLECPWYRITMQFPFFRKSKAFLAVGFRDHSVIWALEFLLKNHNSVLEKNKKTFFGISFTARFWGRAGAGGVWERERNKDRIRDKDREKFFFPFESTCKQGRIILINSITIYWRLAKSEE